MEEVKVTKMSSNKGPWLIALSAMMWATDAPFRVKLLQNIGSTTIVLYEHFVNTIFVTPILIRNRKEVFGLKRRDWYALLFIGLGGSAFASVLFTSAFSYTNPSVVILLQKVQPIIATVLAVIILHEKITRRFVIAAFFVLVGAFFISFPTGFPDTTTVGFPDAVKGAAFALAAAALWGASTVFGKYALKHVTFQTVTALRFVIGLLGLFVYMLVARIPILAHVTVNDVIFVIIVSVVSGAVALLIYYRGLTTTNASYATFIESIGYPIGAVVVNWVFLGATLSPVQLVGMAILLTALMFMSKTSSKESIKADVLTMNP